MADAKVYDQLLQDVEAQRALMISVSTGGPRIDSVNDTYIDRHRRVRDQLTALGITYGVPHDDLWAWYGKWSSGDLPSYQSRREYIGALFRPIIDALRRRPAEGARVFPDPTGWEKVDRTVDLMRTRLAQASTEVEYQGVGHVCREAIIDLAQTVYDPAKHPTMDGVAPSGTDAKRKLEAYLTVELAGRSNEAARRHAKAALDLANDLQHRRTATFCDAALCAEATTSVVNLVAIISGQRNP